MRIFVGVTDSEWYRLLSARPDLSEINFWQPGGTRGSLPSARASCFSSS